jgi:hypothetical protein
MGTLLYLKQAEFLFLIAMGAFWGIAVLIEISATASWQKKL